MPYKLTIIIPVYNEADNLDRVETELIHFLDIAQVPTAVLFVNDGSKDNSLSIIEKMCLRHPAFEYISMDKNYGLSAALKAGFDTINTEYTGYMDADLQTSPEDFNLLLNYIEEFELVTGLRTNRKDRILKRLSSKIANRIRRMFTNDGMDDTGCPLKIIKTEYAKRIPMFRGLHRFLPAMVLLQNGKIIQIPVRHYPRINGTSKFGLSNRFFGPLLDSFAYLWIRKRYIRYNITKKSI